jgi:hypothetical protein
MVAESDVPEATFSEHDAVGVCDKVVTFVHVRLIPKSPYVVDNVVINATSYDRRISKAQLDCATAELLDNVWETMLTEVRYYGAVRGVGDGTYYHFSYAAPGMLAKSGLTLSPPDDSVAGQFVRLGKQLIAYVDSPAKGREAARSEMIRLARQVLQVARDRNTAAAAPKSDRK